MSGDNVTSKTLDFAIHYVYDKDGKLTLKYTSEDPMFTGGNYYEYDKNEGTVVLRREDGKTIIAHSKTDSFGRKEFDELQLSTGYVSRKFSYLAGEKNDVHVENGKVRSTPTTNLVSEIVLSDGHLLSYEYDAEERITKVVDTDTINETSTVTTYTYDALGQLLTEVRDGVTVNTMSYDNYGNITAKNGITYTYDTTWKDLLTAYNGQTITYDAQGNPTTYLGHTLTWEKGRQLKSYDTNTYTYNANGIRTSKTVGGVKHTYILDGAKVLYEKWGDNVLSTLWDNEDSLCGIRYADESYFFLKNLQGDIIAITDKDGTVVARYSYDAWGVPTIVSDTTTVGIATINPFRYRGYYYDSETQLYYLQSRYYNPSVGRFVNADEAPYATIGKGANYSNLYSYCYSSPVIMLDSSGFAVETIIDGISAIWSLIELIITPSWANAGFLAWDVASFFIPFIPGSYVGKGGKLTIKIASKVDDFIDGTKFLTGSYDVLKKVFRWIKGIEVHHLIEKRFRNLFKNVNVNKYLAIPLTKELHQIITNRWRNLHKIDPIFKHFRYGADYTRITYEQMEKAIREVYKDMPSVLEYALDWFRKNWSK